MARRRTSLVTPDAARDLTRRLRQSPDGSPGLVLHAYITHAWAAVGFEDWSAFCRDVVPFQRRPPPEERGQPPGVGPSPPVPRQEGPQITPPA
jgi:hypothetical protein